MKGAMARLNEREMLLHVVCALLLIQANDPATLASVAGAMRSAMTDLGRLLSATSAVFANREAFESRSEDRHGERPIPIVGQGHYPRP